MQQPSAVRRPLNRSSSEAHPRPPLSNVGRPDHDTTAGRLDSELFAIRLPRGVRRILACGSSLAGARIDHYESRVAALDAHHRAKRSPPGDQAISVHAEAVELLRFSPSASTHAQVGSSGHRGPYAPIAFGGPRSFRMNATQPIAGPRDSILIIGAVREASKVGNLDGNDVQAAAVDPRQHCARAVFAECADVEPGVEARDRCASTRGCASKSPVDDVVVAQRRCP